MSPKQAAVKVTDCHLIPVIYFRQVPADPEQVKSERLDLSQDAAQCRPVAPVTRPR